MCGIFGLVRSGLRREASTATLITGTRVVRHRGPDDEGYSLWNGLVEPSLFAGSETATTTRRALNQADIPPNTDWRVGLGHRRLSIVDLSPGGHQPMQHRQTGITVAFNGEIYNHIELRRDLERLGHRFQSQSDTEVLLAAWAQWGVDSLHRFNGMFAFLLLDPRNGGSLHAVRDRFGVKPLYWSRVGDWLVFASEIKQIWSVEGFRDRLDIATVHDYLARGQLDHSRHTFDTGIEQVLGGEQAVVDLRPDNPSVEVRRWYSIVAQPFRGTLPDAGQRFRELLTDSVRIRLRADVPVGSCLSGGLDSSAIVCLANDGLSSRDGHAGQITVTARFEDSRFDEWNFAKAVIDRTHVTAIEVWPNVERLQAELDLQLWHMDEPFGSTSQFSQWCVFAGAAEAGLKVMLDGQGSDEQLAGYAGNETALFTGFMRRLSGLRLAREALAFQRNNGVFPVAQIILAARNAAPALDRLLPSRLRLDPAAPDWLRLDARSHIDSLPPHDLNQHLMRQTVATSLPVLLRYEDRNSMARSIEARVPFLDYRLVEFLAGLPDQFKFSDGITKRVMREGMADVLPEPVRSRRDKMGFVTPEHVWLSRTASTWFRSCVIDALGAAPDVFRPRETLRLVDDVISGHRAFSFTPWRILCFGRWLSSRGDYARIGPVSSDAA